jgi:hypothetical protein
MRSKWLYALAPLLLLMFSLASLPAFAQIAAPKPTAQPQTPRQAILEMLFSKDTSGFDRHLPALAHKKMERVGMLDVRSRPSPFDAEEMRYLTTYDDGPVLFTFDPPQPPGRYDKTAMDPKKRIELTVEGEDDRGDEASFDFALHIYVNGADQLQQIEPRAHVKMVLEKDARGNGIWKLADIGFSGHFPLADPAFLTEVEKEFAPGRMAANEGNAVAGMHAIVAAEVSYQTTYGQYTCSLAALAGDRSSKPSADHAGLIDPGLGSGKRSGYIFRVADCGSGSSFRVSAVPEVPGTTGKRAFCSDVAGTYRSSEDGAEDTCFLSGKPLGSD